MSHQVEEAPRYTPPVLEPRSGCEGCLLVSSVVLVLIGALATYCCWSEIGVSALGLSGASVVLSIALFVCARSQQIKREGVFVKQQREHTRKTRPLFDAETEKRMAGEVERLFQAITTKLQRGEESSDNEPLEASLSFQRASDLFCRIRETFPRFAGAIYVESISDHTWHIRRGENGRLYPQQLRWELRSEQQCRIDAVEVEKLYPGVIAMLRGGR